MVGVDEVGRGCWAGPLLVVAARVISDLPPGLKDSKLLSKQQRDSVYKLLSTNNKLSFGEGWVSCHEIDRLGLSSALTLGGSRALADLKTAAGERIILDGKHNYLPAHFSAVECLVDADALIPLVSAAGIYAKVRRDQFMSKLQIKHPAYGFENHVGYGTAAHRQALLAHGIINGVHRLSFKPIQAIAQAL